MRAATKPPLVLIGMHRSGTSLLARLLSELGVHMGNELDTNHEAICFKNTNKALLSLAGAHWAKPYPFLSAIEQTDFLETCSALAEEALGKDHSGYDGAAAAPVWGWKDPRTTLTLPIWLRLFPEAKIVYVERAALDVTLSLHRREVLRWVNRSEEKRMLPPTLGACYRLWCTYAERGRGFADHPGYLALRYEALLSEPVRELRRLAEFAGLRITDLELSGLAKRRIRQPTPRSGLESARLAVLTRLGLIDRGIFAAGRADSGHEPSGLGGGLRRLRDQR